jgi:anti-sigma factor RsiW
MWHCWFVRRALTAYQDGELITVNGRRIEDHLRTCAHCASELARLNRVSLVVRSLPSPSRPLEYWPQAFQTVREKIQASARSSRMSVIEFLAGMLVSPVLSMVPAILAGVALVNTVLFLGLEEEALAFFATHILSIILD